QVAQREAVHQFVVRTRHGDRVSQGRSGLVELGQVIRDRAVRPRYAIELHGGRAVELGAIAVGLEVRAGVGRDRFLTLKLPGGRVPDAVYVLVVIELLVKQVFRYGVAVDLEADRVVLSLRPALGGHQDGAVGCARTIERRGRAAF